MHCTHQLTLCLSVCRCLTHACTCTHTHTLAGASEDCRVVRDPGIWWGVVAGDRVCCTLRQMESGSFPLERLLAVFSVFNIFDFFSLLPEWLLLAFTKHPLFTSVQLSLTSDDRPSTKNHFCSIFYSLLFHSFTLFLSSSLDYHNEWIWSWHAIWLLAGKFIYF